MGASPKISSLRYLNYIDLYIVRQGQLVHMWCNEQTDWVYLSQTLQAGNNISSNEVVALRHVDYIDLYYINSSGSLCHMMTNPSTGWQHVFEIIDENGLVYSLPACTRFNNHIDIFYITNEKKIRHIYTGSPNTIGAMDYQYSTIYQSPQGQNISNLTALRTNQFVIDIYFICNGHWVHGSAGQHNGWCYQFDDIFHYEGLVNRGRMVPMRYGDYIDLFFADNQGFICSLHASPNTGWQYVNHGRICGGNAKTKDMVLTGMRFEDNIDIYYIGDDNIVYHCYNGSPTGWNWVGPMAISSNNAKCGISCVRKPQAIDVYYLDFQQKLRNYYSGEATNFDWNQYNQCLSTDGVKRDSNGSSIVDAFNIDKPILNWNEIAHKCRQVGKGYHAQAFVYQQLGLIIKRYYRVSLQVILNEFSIMNRLSQVWPNMCKYQLRQNGRLTGFSLFYFKGVYFDELVRNQNSFLAKNPLARLRIVKRLWQIVNLLQSIGVAHADITPGNILINLQNEDKFNPLVETVLIDFSNAILYENGSTTNAFLTGWKLLLPPETLHGATYNPQGVNPYQLARISLSMLLGTKYSQWVSIDPNPQRQIQKLARCQQYHPDLKKRALSFNWEGIQNYTLRYIGGNGDINRRVAFQDVLRTRSSNQRHRHRRIITESNGNILGRLLTGPTDNALPFIQFKPAILKAISCVPVVGQILSVFVDVFWVADPWEDVKQRVQHAINVKIQQHVYNMAKGVCQGIVRSHHRFAQSYTKSQISYQTIRERYQALHTLILGRIDQLQTQQHDVICLPFFVQVINILFSIMRVKYFQGQKWGCPRSEIKQVKQQFQTYLKKYSEYAQKTFDKGLNKAKQDMARFKFADHLKTKRVDAQRQQARQYYNAQDRFYAYHRGMSQQALEYVQMWKYFLNQKKQKIRAIKISYYSSLGYFCIFPKLMQITLGPAPQNELIKLARHWINYGRRSYQDNYVKIVLYYDRQFQFKAISLKQKNGREIHIGNINQSLIHRLQDQSQDHYIHNIFQSVKHHRSDSIGVVLQWKYNYKD